ncbi:MAG: hypothetical protein AABM67_04080 [Acidobacteriota bacterium]
MKGVVAIVDALGVSMYSIEQSQKFLTIRNELISTIERVAGFTSKTLSPKNYVPKLHTFGDTLVFSWEAAADDSDDLHGVIWIGTWLRYLMVLGLRKRILFRGAVAYGEYISEENTILGPAVADSAAWYSSANWFGIICAPSMQFMLNAVAAQAENTSSGSMLAWFLEYQVPLKGREAMKLWTVPWPYDIWAAVSDTSNDKQKAARDAKSSINSLLQGLPVPKGTEDKYVNSLAYLDYCVRAYTNNDKKINDISVYRILEVMKAAERVTADRPSDNDV